MDLHPIIVHIPLAFMAIYSLLEKISFIPLFRKSETFFSIKLFLVFVGVIGAALALSSGENALEVNRALVNESLVEDHEGVAELTYNLYIVILVIYLTMVIVRFENIKNYLNTKFNKIPILLKLISFIEKIGSFFNKNYLILVVLGLAGLVLASITGALGGAIVYGTDAKDPIINIVSSYFGY